LRDYRVYTLTPGDWLREGCIAASIAALICWTFYRSWLLFFISLPAALIIYPLTRKKALKDRRLWQLTLEFKEAMWIVSGYLSAGLSVENAYERSWSELRKIYGDREMITEEFAAVVRGLQLNKPVEILLKDFSDRSGLADIRNFSEVFAIAKRSGGNLGDIIERTTGVIRDRTAVSEEIRNLTASRRYEQNIMNILPFGMILYIRITSPGFMDVMYETLLGRAIMSASLALLIGAVLLARRILDIRM